MLAPPVKAFPVRPVGVRGCIAALSTTLGMQTVASFLSHGLPIIAPLPTEGTGLGRSRCNLSSFNFVGIGLSPLFGGPLS
jgi:hypothetical protein